MRFLASLPGYVYATSPEGVYVNLYVDSTCSVEVGVGGVNVGIEQETQYPWSGAVTLRLEPGRATRLTLAVRIPEWARGAPLPSDLYTYIDSGHTTEVTLRVNGRPVPVTVQRSFARIDRTWKPDDVVELELPLTPQRVVSHDAVVENHGRVAVERGPVVYCAEAVDNGGSALELSLADDAQLHAVHDPSLLGGVTILQAGDVMLIPYFAWAHRGAGEMQTWLRRETREH